MRGNEAATMPMLPRIGDDDCARELVPVHTC